MPETPDQDVFAATDESSGQPLVAPTTPAPLAPTPAPAPVAPDTRAGLAMPKAPAAALTPAVAATQARHSMLGKVASFLLGNQTEYQEDPQTHEIKPVSVPQKPGQLFRSILAGAILGGAAGAPAGDNIGRGATMGAGAVQERARQNDEQAYKRAQDAQQERRAASREEQQRLLTQAQIANMHSEQVARDHQLDLMDKDRLERHNEGMRAMEDTIVKAGGTPANLTVNGQNTNVLTAQDLVGIVNKTPQELNGPQGYTRVFVDSTDLSKVSFNGTQWVDESGKPVNMSNQTTIKVYDVPDDAMNKKVPTSGAAINQAAGQQLTDPKKSYPMSPAEMAALNSNRLKNDREDSLTKLNERRAQVEIMQAQVSIQKIKQDIRAGDKAEAQIAIDTARAKIAGIGDQLRAATATMDPQAIATANEQMKQALKDLDDAQAEIRSRSGKTPKAAPPAAAPTVTETRNNIPLDPATAKVFDTALKSGNSTDMSWDDIQQIPALTQPSQRVGLAAALHVPIPLQVVAAMAQAARMTPEQMAQQLESGGATVEKPTAPQAQVGIPGFRRPE